MLLVSTARARRKYLAMVHSLGKSKRLEEYTAYWKNNSELTLKLLKDRRV
jgi:hypothetical protein